MPQGDPPDPKVLKGLPSFPLAGEILHRIFRRNAPDGSPRSPWWFSSTPDGDDAGCRFDLPTPHGACYWGRSAVAAALEALQGLGTGLLPIEELSVRRRAELIAPDSAPEAADLANPQAYGIAGVTAALWGGGDDSYTVMAALRAKTQRWAAALFDAEWHALHHGIQHDPSGSERAVTLLDTCGAHLPYLDVAWQIAYEEHDLHTDAELHESLRAWGLVVLRSDVDLPMVALADVEIGPA